MKDYKAIYEECRYLLQKMGICTRDDINVVINSRAKSRWGLCKIAKGNITIEISDRLLDDNVPDTSLKDVMIHELLHSVAPGYHHGGKWLYLAKKVNDRYPDLNIVRGESAAAYGVKDDFDYKYIIKCTKCGHKFGRRKMSKVITNLNEYRCKCGGDLVLVKG